MSTWKIWSVYARVFSRNFFLPLHVLWLKSVIHISLLALSKIYYNFDKNGNSCHFLADEIRTHFLMWNHHRSAAQSVLLFSLIIARLLPAAAAAQRSAECYRLRLLARSRLLASDSTAARGSRASQQQQQRLSCGAAVRPSFVCCGLAKSAAAAVASTRVGNNFYSNSC